VKNPIPLLTRKRKQRYYCKSDLMNCRLLNMLHF
jgi:hypothetical protein